MNCIPLFTVLSSKYSNFIITRILAAQERKNFIFVISVSEEFRNFENFDVSLKQKEGITILQIWQS